MTEFFEGLAKIDDSVVIIAIVGTVFLLCAVMFLFACMWEQFWRTMEVTLYGHRPVAGYYDEDEDDDEEEED